MTLTCGYFERTMVLLMWLQPTSIPYKDGLENHEGFYFKMSTFVTMMWNHEFLIKKLEVIKIYFRHFYPGAHTGRCTDYDFRTHLCSMHVRGESGKSSAVRMAGMCSTKSSDQCGES